METFTPISSALGGMLIGLASASMLVLNGRIAGISGIAGGLLGGDRTDAGWRVSFLAGLVIGGALVATFAPGAFAFTIDRTLPMLFVAGFLVGVGTRLGSGCTSGHGVCGLSRFSKRSLVAVLVFMASAAVTVNALRLFGVTS